MRIGPGRSALVALTLFAGTIACGTTRKPASASSENAAPRPSSPSVREEPEAFPDTAGPTAPAEAPRGEAVRVRVEQVGQEPRRALRLQFSAGTQQLQSIRAETRIIAPRTKQSLTLEGRRTARILDVTSDGTARFSVEVEPLTLTTTEARAEGSGQATDSTSAQASSSGEADTCGFWLNHRVNVDAAKPGALALTATALAQAADPLPPEEVGSGAVWVAIRVLEGLGLARNVVRPRSV